MLRFLTLITFSVTVFFSSLVKSETTYSQRIQELERIQELLAAHQVLFEEEERQFSDPIWMANASGVPYVANGSKIREKLQGFIFVARSMGLDRAARSYLSPEKQLVIDFLGKEKVDTIAVSKIMDRLRETSESIRRETISEIDDMQSKIANEVASLEQKEAALETALTVVPRGTSSVGGTNLCTCEDWNKNNLYGLVLGGTVLQSDIGNLDVCEKVSLNDERCHAQPTAKSDNKTNYCTCEDWNADGAFGVVRDGVALQKNIGPISECLQVAQGMSSCR